MFLYFAARMSMYRPHWMPSVGDPGGYSSHQAQPSPLHPPGPHQPSSWPTPPPSTRLASSASPPSSYTSSATSNMGTGGVGPINSSTSGNQPLPPTPPKDSHNIQQSQSQDHQIGHPHSQLHSHVHQPKHEPSTHHYPEPNSNCLMGAGQDPYEASLSRDDSSGGRLNNEQGTPDQYNHQQHHETKDNLLNPKSELNPTPASMGQPASVDIKNQPQSPSSISHGSTAYDHHPPSSSANSYNTGAPSGNEHDGYQSNVYSNIPNPSSTAYSPPLHHSHQSQPSHHSVHHNSSGSSLLGSTMGGESGVRGSASSTGGSDYSANNMSPPINHSGMSDAGLSSYSSSGHAAGVRSNSAFNSSSNPSKSTSKGKNRPNAGKEFSHFSFCDTINTYHILS